MFILTCICDIFVSEDDPSHITAIIDWDSICIQPAFRHVDNEPDLVQDPVADIPMLNQFMSENDDTTTEQSSEETPAGRAAREKHEHGVKLRERMFEVVLAGFSKNLREVRALNPTLSESSITVAYPGHTAPQLYDRN